MKMAVSRNFFWLIPVVLVGVLMVSDEAGALLPYTARSMWDMMMLPPNYAEDPFRILEQTPLSVPKAAETLALARADWKETASAHVISMDIPGVKKEDLKIEVEENRVLRISGEMKAEEETDGEKWHRAERSTGKFWRQFRLPGNADMEGIKAPLENGVLKITVPKVAEEEKKKKEAKVVKIEEAEGGKFGRDDVEATRAEM